MATMQPAIRTLTLVLVGTGTGMIALALLVMAVRAIDEIGRKRRLLVVRACQPLVDKLLLPQPSIRVAEALACHVPRHGRIVGQLLVEAARLASGPPIHRLRHTARIFGLLDVFKEDLTSGKWRVRMEAARALGRLEDASAVDLLIAALDDPREDVRGAAVEALGQIADARAVAALVRGLSALSSLQRQRVTDAVRRFGAAAIPSLLEHEKLHPEDHAGIAELLEQAALGGPRGMVAA